MKNHIMIAVALLSLGGQSSLASHTGSDPAEIGELGPLIPFHKDAIHAGLGWADGRGHSPKRPKICFWMRPSEFQGIHLVDPSLTPGPGALKPKFEKYVYGRNFTAGRGFRFSTGVHGLDESVATGIEADLNLDNGLCFDLGHPHAFRNSGKFSVADLTDADFDLNRRAFSNAGHSKGLNYNIFCAGQVALANGEWVFVGGHDKAGNNGIRKITIFNPATQSWADRGLPATKEAFVADPDISDPASHPDPNDEANTDPPHPSDMTYQRWYPTAVHLPNDTVLVLSGTDQDSSLLNASLGDAPCPSATFNPSCSKYRPNAPEIYIPRRDRTIALENAWKVLSMYPIAYPVQTGPRRKDWKVAVIGEVDHSVSTTGEPFRGDFSDQARGIEISSYDPWPYSGKTYLFDVRAARRDPERGVPNETGRYWELVDTAAIAHEGGASAMLVKLDERGQPLSQKLVLFGGGCGERPDAFVCDQATVETIDFQDPAPDWTQQQSLIQEVGQVQALALPDGNVLVVGGSRGRGSAPGGWRNSFHYQLYDPSDGTVTPLVETNLPTHDHATVLLLPDGSVIRMGGNRTDLVYFTDPAGTSCQVGAQCSDQDTRNSGVPVAQIYKPPYFFNSRRPTITNAPGEISYKERFDLRVSRRSGEIASVAIIQQHPKTHNHMWNRRVELWFEQNDRELEIQAPRFAGVAPPGDYLLFVIDDDGVPSVGKLIHLDTDREDDQDGHDGHDDHDHHGDDEEDDDE